VSIVRCKREAFLKTNVDAERSSSRELWCSVNSLMSRGRDTSALGVSADELHKFFNDCNVSALRASTSDAPSPTFSAVSLGCSFNSFQPLIAEDVMRAVRALPDKQCCSDSRRAGDVPRRATEQIAGSRHRTDWFQSRVHHTAAKETRP